MYSTAEAIVLHSIPYSDNKYIVSLYSREHGRIEAIARRQKSRNINTLLTPLNIVSIGLYSKPNANMFTITDIQISQIAYKDDIQHKTIKLYLAELLYRTLKQPIREEELYQYIRQAIYQIDSQDNISNAHIVIQMQLTAYLGFMPNIMDREHNTLLDLESGLLTAQVPPHRHYLDAEHTTLLQNLLVERANLGANIVLSRQQRQHLLNNLQIFYQLHFPGFTALQSLPTLIALYN